MKLPRSRKQQRGNSNTGVTIRDSTVTHFVAHCDAWVKANQKILVRIITQETQEAGYVSLWMM